MNEELDIDDRNEIDDVFRDSLSGYTESPSDRTWAKLNRKLSRKEFADFVTFKKTPGLTSAQKLQLPMYRQQWVRIAAAASVALIIVYVSGVVLKRQNQDFSTNPSPYMVQETHNDTRGTFSGIFSLPEDQQQPIGYHYFVAGNDIFLQEDKKDADHIQFVPPLRSIPQPDSERDNVFYADNTTDGGSRNVTVQENTAIPRDQHMAVQHAKSHDFHPGNPGIAIADAGFNVNDPLININIRSSQNNPEVARQEAARVVDSLIRANAIKDYGSRPQVGSTDTRERDAQIDSGQHGPEKDKTTARLSIPNVITPNSDGINDYFAIKNLEHYPDNTLLIFDRNGKTVYQVNGYQNDWDGGIAADGTYYYILTYKTQENESITTKGLVYILRN